MSEQTNQQIDARITAATSQDQPGWAVAWGQPKRPFRQTVFFSTRDHADQFVAGLHAGEDAQSLLLRIWGLGRPLTHADLGRIGGPARAAALTPRRRSQIARKAGRARWLRVTEAKAATVDDPAIKRLRREAAAAGDLAMVAICDRALDVLDEDTRIADVAAVNAARRLTVLQARAECADAIADAASA